MSRPPIPLVDLKAQHQEIADARGLAVIEDGAQSQGANRLQFPP